MATNPEKFVTYKECRRNHCRNLGRSVYDGCLEFTRGGVGGTLDDLLCVACGCHRDFHRLEEVQPIHRCQACLLNIFHHRSVRDGASTYPPLPFPLILPPHLLAVNGATSCGLCGRSGTPQAPEEINISYPEA
ncbi:hypothetical protein RJ639_037566 [Escallonia herrerae]|uniref:ZF-HD dimerization-type domain-containing protein n=1 Tax=Escallonia herrerae TaxID=1293975 RepID=A0AA89B872_9ASTE|nr:hypothetical protein RJ639_037566 [Escallonia herrerae]